MMVVLPIFILNLENMTGICLRNFGHFDQIKLVDTHPRACKIAHLRLYEENNLKFL